ncbi:hypothetical protein B0H11DRAFT_1863347 [Mycena galericulata]|nr:hypothetical protein B0H11DRAFT_1863347 [Mycena galericulata]
MHYSPASSSSSSSSSSPYSSWSPSSSSRRSPPVHAASLVDPSTHSPELMQLLDIKLSRPVIEYVVDCVSETVDYAMGRTTSPTRGRSHTRSAYHAKFASFVSTVLSRAEVGPSTILVALVYMERARPHLSISLEQWALERVFLGALIVAAKYTNDSTLKNVHWALCTGLFGKRDVGRIEREFLDVLAWELGVAEDDLVTHHEGLMSAAGRYRHRNSTSSSSSSISAYTSPYLAVPRTHTHRRPTAPVVPELSPSSPHSSDASLSPRTPAHPDVPLDVDPATAAPPAKSHATGKLHDLLHVFPRSHGRSFPVHVVTR